MRYPYTLSGRWRSLVRTRKHWLSSSPGLTSMIQTQVTSPIVTAVKQVNGRIKRNSRTKKNRRIKTRANRSKKLTRICLCWKKRLLTSSRGHRKR